jgi:hypothetical protein
MKHLQIPLPDRIFDVLSSANKLKRVAIEDDEKGGNKDPYLENRLRMQPQQRPHPRVENETPPGSLPLSII